MADLSSQPAPIQSIYGWFREDKLYVNRRYQRKLVWTLEEKQKLVESILKKYPVPAILIAERDSALGTYEIIDGLQRLQAIMSFIETSFPTLDNRYFDIKHFSTAKGYADAGAFSVVESQSFLSQKEVSTILDYNLALSVMRNATELEINDVFNRINTYGHRLSDQERRQSGVQNAFSTMVRELACTLRGDVSAEVLTLKDMPSISIDLPKIKHGYQVKAEDVFWVKQGILRSSDLRDSMDEQCIADIAACVVGGELIERAKDALDAIYEDGNNQSDRINAALEIYGIEKFSAEFKYCIDRVIEVCNCHPSEKLRDIVFKKRTTNAFPSTFATLLMAFHELIVKDGKSISDYTGLKNIINNIGERIETGKKATSVEERRKNINQVKGLIGTYFISSKNNNNIYQNHTSSDVDSDISRSKIEIANFEFKQGLLRLSDSRDIDNSIFEKVIKTICAIANNGPNHVGKIIIGVADKDEDAKRIEELYSIKSKKVAGRHIVGVEREAKQLGINTDRYFQKWKDAIKNSLLSEPLKSDVLSHLDYNSYFGYGVIVITIRGQKSLSFFGDDVYWRSGDSTEVAKAAKQVSNLTLRFSLSTTAPP